MLSRAAERVYWTGRYLERAENTARIIQQYSQLLLDLPPEVGVEWGELVKIFGAVDSYGSSGQGRDETSIVQFLLAEPMSVCSLAYSLRMARENIRNTRDLLPQESWESANECYRFARDSLSRAAAGENRFEVLADCIGRCQQINGILSGTMSHRSPYHFLTLGQRIERADMTSRIIDVAAAYVQQNEQLVRRYGSTLWTNVLKSVSGFQMYRQYCHPHVEGSRVIDFLLHDDTFPRAIHACIATARDCAESLPRGERTIDALDAVGDLVRSTPIASLGAGGVSAAMDALQKRLGEANRAVATTWFSYGVNQ
ncbi:MAG: alpha-E domain-containing protein [Gammaproteobacteria bacterium]